MKASTIALSIIAIVLVITTGLFASMYYSEVSAYNTKASQVSADTAEIQQLSSELSSYSAQAALAAAMSHWNNIAIESVQPIVQQYTSNAVLNWVGGPLSGTYTGTSQISSVWTKFSNLYETVYWYAVSPPTVTEMNSSYYVVTAPLQFFVAPTSNPENIFVLNVTETLGIAVTPTSQLIANEVWKVSPLPLTAVIAGYPGQNTLIEDEVLTNAYAHWNNIAIENVSLIMQEYGPSSTLTWIGGPLHGNYTGIQQINATWTKFANFYEYVVWYAEEPPTVTVSGTTAMASAQLQFIVFPFPTSANPTPHAVLLNVNDTLVYTFSPSTGTWTLTHETWQVAPAPISEAAPGYSSPQYT